MTSLCPWNKMNEKRAGYRYNYYYFITIVQQKKRKNLSNTIIKFD